MTIAQILKQAERLSTQERKTLVKLLVDSLDLPSNDSQHSILEFRGIAAHLADDEDPQDYVNRIRSEWDDSK